MGLLFCVVGNAVHLLAVFQGMALGRSVRFPSEATQILLFTCNMKSPDSIVVQQNHSELEVPLPMHMGLPMTYQTDSLGFGDEISDDEFLFSGRKRKRSRTSSDTGISTVIVEVFLLLIKHATTSSANYNVTVRFGCGQGLTRQRRLQGLT